MDKLMEAAKATKELADLLCISIEDVWEKHTDESVKEDLNFSDVKAKILEIDA